MIQEIYKINNIGKGFLAVMAKPVAGHYANMQFELMAQSDINQVVSLQQATERVMVGLNDEGKYCTGYGMDFVSFPIPDHDVPDDFSSYLALIKDLHRQIRAGRNTVIHCYGGIGRTGIVAAGILLLDGMTLDDALELLSYKRGIRMPETREQHQWLVKHVQDINT